MKKYILFIVLLLALKNVYSQNWTFLSGTTINDLFIASKDTIFIVGDKGRILRSTDSGIKWNVVFNDLELKNLNSLYFYNSTTGFAGGHDGLLLKTLNGGTTWSIVSTNLSTTASFNKLHFNGSIGNALLGGQIYYTNDAGLTWTFKSGCNACEDFTFPEPNIGYNGDRFTTDGGFTWQITSRNFTNSMFLTPNIGFKVGSNLIYRTRNGGASWQYNGTPYGITDAWFLDSLNGYATSNDLGFLHTTNAGRNWTPIDNPPNVTSLQTIKYGHGIAFGYYYWGENLLRMENNEAKIVLGQISQSSYSLNDAKAINIVVAPDSSIHVSQQSYLYKLRSGEKKWHEISTGEYIQDMFFVHKDTGFAVAHYLLKTTNGGETWNNTNIIVDAQSLFFTSSRNGFYGSGTNYILGKSTNAGASWSSQFITSSGSGIRAIYFPTATTGYIVSTAGKINKTINGTNWTVQTSGVTADLNDVYFTDANKGFIVGNAGTLLTTINGGTLWQKVTLSTTVDLNAVYFLSPDIGYVVGNSGTVLITTNGGTNWSILPLLVKDNLYSIHFLKGLGYIAGENNLVLELNYAYAATAVLPTLSTSSISSINTSTAGSGGNISNDGGAAITARGVVWGTSPNPTIAGNKTTDGSGSGIFTSSLSGLISGMTYYVRAYATNSAGTSYGNEVSFTTIALPTISTTSISTITTSTASGGGNVNNDGGSTVTARGICWGTSSNPTTADNKTIDGSGIGSFTSSLSGLISNTTYFVRAYATNSAGTEYGTEVSFTTSVETGLKNTSLKNNISIYPNPGNGMVTLDIQSLNSEYIETRVLDSKGIEVYNGRINNFSGNYNEIIDLSSLSKGFYYLQIITDTGIFIDKLIISE